MACKIRGTAWTAALLIGLAGCSKSTTPTPTIACQNNVQFAAVVYARNWASDLIEEKSYDAARELLLATHAEATKLLQKEWVQRRMEVKDDSYLLGMLSTFDDFRSGKREMASRSMLKTVDERLVSYRKLTGCRLTEPTKP